MGVGGRLGHLQNSPIREKEWSSKLYCTSEVPRWAIKDQQHAGKWEWAKVYFYSTWIQCAKWPPEMAKFSMIRGPRKAWSFMYSEAKVGVTFSPWCWRCCNLGNREFMPHPCPWLCQLRACHNTWAAWQYVDNWYKQFSSYSLALLWKEIQTYSILLKNVGSQLILHPFIASEVEFHVK